MFSGTYSVAMPSEYEFDTGWFDATLVPRQICRQPSSQIGNGLILHLDHENIIRQRQWISHWIRSAEMNVRGARPAWGTGFPYRKLP
jgi:hypothetical protein